MGENWKRWTRSAVDCYKRGGVCEGCFYDGFFSVGFKCQMKKAVLTLVRNVGAPPRARSPEFSEEILEG